MTVMQKEVPIKIIFSDKVKRPKKYSQHIKRVRLSGPEHSFPEELRLEADEIAQGGEITIDDLVLPEHFDVIGRRDFESIVTVETQKREKRETRDNWDDR